MTKRTRRNPQPPLRAVGCMAVNPVFPTLNNIDEVIELAKSKVPINEQNAVVSLLMTYHNTLITQLNKK